MATNTLKVLFWNARGVSSKIQELQLFLSRDRIDVACVCETFLKSDKNLTIKGYKTIQANRTTGRFGGLIIFIKDNISFSQINIPVTSLIETLGVRINKVHLFLIYLPGQARDPLIKRDLIHDLNQINNQYTNRFLMGDFNARHRSWNCDSNNTAGNILFHYINNSNNFVTAPADHTYCPVATNMRPSTIDLVLTDSLSSHSRPWVVNDFHSDHLPVRFDITMDVIREK